MNSLKSAGTMRFSPAASVVTVAVRRFHGQSCRPKSARPASLRTSIVLRACASGGVEWSACSMSLR